MAVVHISDEDFAALQHLSADKGLSPDELLQAIIHEAIRRDQAAFWGPDVVAEIERERAEHAHAPRERLTGDEFLVALAADKTLTVAERIALLQSLQTKDAGERTDQQTTLALLVEQLHLDDAAAK